MKKKWLSLIISAIVIIILIPIYFYVVKPSIENNPTDFTNKKGTHGETLSSAGRPFIIDPMDKSQISVLKITNKSLHGGYELYRGEDGEMYLRGAEKHLYDTQKLSSLYTNAATYLLAMEKLKEHENDLTTYSLTPETSLATIEITTVNGVYSKIIIGAKLPTGGGYYAKLDSRDAVYVIDTMLEETVFCDPCDLIFPLMAPAIPQTDYSSIQEFSLSKDGAPFINIVKLSAEEEESSAIYGSYKMTYPAEYIPSTENYSSILAKFISFTANRILDYDINEDKLHYYGFKTGTKYELSYTYNGILTELYFSGKTPDNTYYVYSPSFDLVGEIDASKMEFLEWDLIKFVDRNIFMININNISSINISTPNNYASFSLSGDDSNLSVTCNGNAIDTENFRYFYKSILSIVIEGYATLPENALPFLTMTLTIKNGTTMAFDFYEVSTLNAFFTVNGAGEFYVRRDQLKALLSNMSKVMNGEKVS